DYYCAICHSSAYALF
nr:immunoglobulin light chain junction region [Macaca mulatta]